MASRQCEECGFDFGTAGVDAPDALRAFGRRYRAPLTRFLPGEDGDRLLRTRPRPEVWSALEYAAHVRDVLEWYGARIATVAAEERPQLMAFDVDAACEERRYREQDPEAVFTALATNADALAEQIASLPASAWSRVGIGSSGEERSVAELVGRAWHEGHHHLLDIGRVLREVRGR